MNDKLIAQSDLFRGISPEEAAAMLHCLQAVERRYPKGALICRQGEAVPAAGLLLSGEVHIVQDVKEHGQCQKGRNAGSNRERAGKAWNTRVFEG